MHPFQNPGGSPEHDGAGVVVAGKDSFFLILDILILQGSVVRGFSGVHTHL